MASLIGQVLDDKYRIDGLLAQGGMGTVYKAYDVDSGVERAIKVIHDRLTEDRHVRDHFGRTAQILSTLEHPHIVRVLDYSSNEAPHLYLVMEFVDGPSLRQRIEKPEEPDQALEPLDAVELVRQVCDAVAYLHSQDPPILHGDIKPGSIILRPKPGPALEFEPVLAGLGLATSLQEDQFEAQGALAGTPAYMAPERVLGEKIDVRSDVWSLGVLLYELVTGRLPFRAQTIDEIIEIHGKGVEPPRPGSICTELQQEVEDVILKALEREPARRYSNVNAMAKRLANIAEPDNVTLITRVATRMGLAQVEDVSSEDIIFVMGPDGSSTPYRFDAEELTIGREPDNKLILDHSEVSRHHAKVTFDGEKYWVEDLDSTNETWLGNSKLVPYQPEEWTPAAVLHVAKKYRLFLHSSRLPGPTIPVIISIQPRDLRVEPGEEKETSLTIINIGNEADYFELAVGGVPEEWVTFHPSREVSLIPCHPHELTLTIHPPKEPDSTARDYELNVQARSMDDPQRMAEAPATLTVKSYHRFSSWLNQTKIPPQDKPAARVTVENQGNVQETYDIRWVAAAGDLQFEPSSTRLTVDAGKKATAESSLEAPFRLAGRKKSHDFCARVRSPDGEVERPAGELISKALLPIGVELAALIVAVLSLIVTVIAIFMS